MRRQPGRAARVSVLLACGLSIAAAPAAPAQPIPAGWSRIPDTKIQPLCPPDGYNGWGYDFSSRCDSVVDGWSSAVWTGQRLLITGGGHGDYYGNEVYALDPAAGTMQRLTDPVAPFWQEKPRNPPNQYAGTCTEHGISIDPDLPNARHTYGGMVWMPSVKRVWLLGGAPSPGCGSFEHFSDGGVVAHHEFDPATSTWKLVPTTGDHHQHNTVGYVASWDEARERIIYSDRHFLFAYYPDTHAYELLRPTPETLNHFSYAAIDNITRKWLIVGHGKAWLVNLNDTTQMVDVSSVESCRELIESDYPGLAWDPVAQELVAWGGRRVDPDTVFHIRTEPFSCTTEHIPGAPKPNMNGTFGRFRYVARLDAFVVVNRVNEDAWLLRLERGAPASTRESSPHQSTQTTLR